MLQPGVISILHSVFASTRCITIIISNIAVVPVASLMFSKPSVQEGSSVNVTCTAKSYPPADQKEYYFLQHPRGVTLEPTHLSSGVDGVIYEISSANSNDGGEYSCLVSITELVDDGFITIQSEIVQAYLLVYGKNSNVGII